MPAFDSIGDFQAANTQVLGISTDSPFSHDNWAKSVGISNYPLLSDIHRTVVKDYGVTGPTGTRTAGRPSSWTSRERSASSSGTEKGDPGARQDPRRGQEARLDVAGHVMADYILESRVWLARPRAEVFAFFTESSNLALITPASFRLPRRRRTPRASTGAVGSPSVVARRADALARVRARVGSALSLHRRPAPGPVRPAGSIGIDSWRSGAGRGWTTG